jgi:hypothetical protein
MEYLGYIFDAPEMDKSTKNWSPVELVYDEQDNFNAATSKVLKLFKHPDGDGKCIVTDSDGEKYVMDIVHATYDIYANSIKVFPTDCRKMK